jgi:FAD/FMN-containing dehydrogenase
MPSGSASVVGAGTRPAREADAAALRASLRGEVLSPADPGYEAARALWNAAVATRPGVIARCTGTADVVAAIRHARAAGLLVAVRGGGHNVAGTASCDGGLVLDLSPMKGVQVDPAGRTAWAQPGLLWGELDHETQAFGLATTGGIVTHTGIAGLTLGGGIGWLMRKYGLTCDNLLEVDLVTADGEVVRASGAEHPELFWGVRGGGGNFGVVTAFRYRLHEVGPTVLAGPIFFPAEDARELLRWYRDFAADAPDELTTVVNLRHAPPLPVIPERLHGVPVVGVVACWSGPIEEGERVLAPLRRHGRPLLDLIGPRPYAAHQGTFDATVPHGLHYTWRSESLAALDDEAVDVLVDNAWEHRSPRSYTIVFQLGGAVARVPADATAYAGRGAGFVVNVNAVSLGPGHGDQAAWAHCFWRLLRPLSTGVYMNFLEDEGHDRVRAAYGPATYDRLAALKAAWDPDNFFQRNQNIRPASGRSSKDRGLGSSGVS